MNKLTSKQLKALPLMVQGMSGKDVAKEVSVAPQTVSEWKKSPEFMATLNSLRMEALESAACLLQQSPSKAVQALINLMENSENEETKRKAALDVLRLAGFEPGKHESYAWGVGPTNVEAMTHEINGTVDLSNILKFS
jgi:transposase